MTNFALAVKAWIVDEKGRLLTIKRTPDDPHMPGIWECPGGRLEAGESPFTGIIREVKEEVGLDIEVGPPLTIWHFTRDDEQKITFIVFVCNPINNTNNKVKLSHEHTEYSWEDLNKKKSEIKLYKDWHNDLDEYKKRFAKKSE